MNNLTTRRIVLGMLMTLVLAFSVQGTADAVDSSTIGIGDLNTLSIGRVITVTRGANLNNSDADVEESITIKVTGGGANFTDPKNINKKVSSHTWYEDPSSSQSDITDSQ